MEEKTPSQHAEAYIKDTFRLENEEEMAEIAWKFLVGKRILKVIEDNLEHIPKGTKIVERRWGVDSVQFEFGKFIIDIQQQIQ